jgi:hypothetical protein
MAVRASTWLHRVSSRRGRRWYDQDRRYVFYAGMITRARTTGRQRRKRNCTVRRSAQGSDRRKLGAPELHSRIVAAAQVAHAIDAMTISEQAVLRAGFCSILRSLGSQASQDRLWEMEESPGCSSVMAHRFVLGHSVMANHRIGQRFGGKVVLIDTGMLSSYFRGGRGSALEILDGRLRAIYDDGTAVVGSSLQLLKPSRPAPRTNLNTGQFCQQYGFPVIHPHLARVERITPSRQENSLRPQTGLVFARRTLMTDNSPETAVWMFLRTQHARLPGGVRSTTSLLRRSSKSPM